METPKVVAVWRWPTPEHNLTVIDDSGMLWEWTGEMWQLHKESPTWGLPSQV